MKTALKAFAVLALLCFASTVYASPKTTIIPMQISTEGKVAFESAIPQVIYRDARGTLTAVASTNCPGGAPHCIIYTWVPAADAASLPALGYNIYTWQTGTAAPVCANGTCTGVAPVNASPVGVGCTVAAGTCTFTVTTIGAVAIAPGSWSGAATATLNNAQSVLSNIIISLIAPLAPVLSGTGQ